MSPVERASKTIFEVPEILAFENQRKLLTSTGSNHFYIWVTEKIVFWTMKVKFDLNHLKSTLVQQIGQTNRARNYFPSFKAIFVSASNIKTNCVSSSETLSKKINFGHKFIKIDDHSTKISQMVIFTFWSYHS